MEEPVFERQGILVIDDDESFNKAITQLGRYHKIPISSFESLDELGRLALLGNYDVVILDFFLESMDGLEIARYIDAFFPDLPAVLTSGQAYLTTGDKGMPRCVKNFVLKACGLENILAAAKQALRERQAAFKGREARGLSSAMG